MPDLSDLRGTAKELYRRAVGAPGRETDPGVAACDDGAAAVARLEAAIADGAGLGAGWPAAGSARRFDRSAGRAAGRLYSSNGRGSLAAAIGLAAAGDRATAFLAGPDLLRSADLLASAAANRLPLVVHLAARDPGRAGGGHAALHAAAASGAAVLVAADVQEAIDLAVAGRRLAEDALVPVVVAVDGAETAASVQDFLFPTGELVAEVLGAAGDTVHAPTRSQELLFGKHRRRLVRWSDPGRPLTTGALFGPEAAAAAAAGRLAYLDSEVPALLETALGAYGERTGRPLAPVSTYKTDGARVVLVAMGAAVRTAEAAADALRSRGVKAGVVGVRVLRPFPEERLAEVLAGLSKAKAVAVLDRVGEPVDAGGGPLAARVRGVVARMEGAVPPVVPVLYGVGGAALRAADLGALCRAVEEGRAPGGARFGRLKSGRYNLRGDGRSKAEAGQKGDGRSEGAVENGGLVGPVFLGVSFDGSASGSYPKRQVLLDALSRSYPGAERLGLAGGAEDALDLRPADATVVSLHRVAGRGGERIAADAARVLHGAVGGSVHVLPGVTWERWARPVTDRLTLRAAGAGPSFDPGADSPADVAVWLTPAAPPTADLVDGLAEGAVLVIPRRRQSDQDLTDWWTDLAAPVREAVEKGGATLHLVEVDGDGPHDDVLLGALLGALKAEGRIDFKERKLLDAVTELGGQARSYSVQSGLERVRPIGGGDLSVRRRPPAEADPVPAAVRRITTSGRRKPEETADSLPRFWDQVGVLYRRGEVDRLTPDPYLASGALPPLSGSLREVSRGRDVLPAFDAARCTGCGDCWTACPDGAVGPIVLGAKALLDQAMARAKRAGRSADSLRMAASKITSAVNAELASRPDDESGADAAELFSAAFDSVIGALPVPDAKKDSLREAFGAVREQLEGLPVSRTAPFFGEPEFQSKGSGELLSIAIDPDACKGCGICIAECEPEALTAAADSPSRTKAARASWRLAEELPEPSADTLTRAREHEDVGPLAAVMMPKASREAMAAADGADAGSGGSLALRQALAAASFHLLAPEGPRKARLEEIDALREELAEEIHGGLARALPSRDLDALAEGLGTLERPEADLSELTSRIEGALEHERVDAARMRRLVDVARKVTDLRVRAGGSDETVADSDRGGIPAPSALGLVLAGRAASWGGAFPYTPFSVPVTVDSTGDAAGVARGLAEGRMREALEGARILRRARIELEAKSPSEASKAAEEVRALRDLSWRDLDQSERALAPPVLLVASEDELLGDDAAGLADLVADDLPVKVLLLSDAHLGSAGRDLATGHPDERSARPAADRVLGQVLGSVGGSTGAGAYVAQSSVGAGDHLERALATALGHEGPAVLRVHAPEPARHGFPARATVERARRAVASRAWPLWTGGRTEAGLATLDLAGNPSPDAGWARVSEETEDGESAERTLTPADWALGEARFADAFGPVPADSARARPETVPLADFLELDRDERDGKLPVVELPDGTPRAVRPALVSAVEERFATWRLLQRWGAADEAFAEAAAATAERERADRLEREHEREIEALRAEYETRLAELENRTKAEMARRVREKLLALALRKRDLAGGNGEATPEATAPEDTESADEKPAEETQ